MEPFHFGRADSPMFGVYHPPVGRANGSHPGALLCAPFGREYLRSHRAFRQLAAWLARAGVPALRFDYHGCGDSAGEATEGSPERWLADLDAALSKLRSLTRSDQVSIVGLRLGATLGAVAAARAGVALDTLVLWDPILSGRAYVAELLEEHRAWLADLKSRLLSSPKRVNDSLERTSHFQDDDTIEIKGFPLTPAMRRDLQGMDLGELAACEARRLVVLETVDSPRALDLAERFRGLGVESTHRHVVARPVWSDREELLVPAEVLRTIVSVLGPQA